MKRTRHNVEQIVKKLREADAMISAGKTIGQVCQALEVSEQTFHRWRNPYGGMKAGWSVVHGVSIRHNRE
jgi:putative transposase